MEPIPDRIETQESPAGTYHGPEVGLWTRLHFVWFFVVALGSTMLFSAIQVVSHQFRPTARNFHRWARAWGGSILAGMGIRVRYEEEAPLDPEKPYVFVANHQNLLDILALPVALPYPFGFIAKAELARVPFLGIAVRNSASVFIDRSDRRKAVESLQRAGERIRGGNGVLIFPEGARAYGPDLLPLKKGAFLVAIEAGVPVVPVRIHDAYRLMDERRRVSRPGTIRITLGTPIPMEGLRRHDIPDLIETLQNRLSVGP